MKKNKCVPILVCLCFFAFVRATHAATLEEQSELKKIYEFHVSRPSDIQDHIPMLRDLARDCSSVVEIGIRSMVSTWGILQGLAESSGELKFYLGVDLLVPPEDSLNLAKRLSKAHEIDYVFLQANDLEICIPPVDMLFIDSLHTYCHLTYELESFAPMVQKYIALHDTSDPWGNRDEVYYKGDYSEYPAHYNRTKKGLWPAVEDFLLKHPEWELLDRHFNCHGFTILQRVEE